MGSKTNGMRVPFLRQWLRLVPLAKECVLILASVVGIGVGMYSGRDVLVAVSLGVLAGTAFIRCAWCRHPIWLRFIAETIPVAAFPLDGECPSCRRSLWTRPPE